MLVANRVRFATLCRTESSYSVKTLLDLEYQLNGRGNNTRNKSSLGIKIGNSEGKNLEQKLKPSVLISNTT